MFTLAEPPCQMCLSSSRDTTDQQGEQVLVSACRQSLKIDFKKKSVFTKPTDALFVSAMQCTFISALNHLHQVPYPLSRITEDVCVVKSGVC